MKYQLWLRKCLNNGLLDAWRVFTGTPTGCGLARCPPRLHHCLPQPAVRGGSLGRWCDTGRLLFCSKVNKPANEQWDESGKDSEVMLKRHLKVMITGIAMQELRRLCFMQYYNRKTITHF